MVVVPLKSQFVSVIITFGSTLSELLIFGSFIRFNRCYETDRLYKGHHLRILAHVKRTRFIAFLAALFFITLELFVSFYTDPETIIRKEQHSCISLDSVRRSNVTDFDFDGAVAEAVKGECFTIEDGVFQQRGGMATLELNRVMVQCVEDGTIFSFRLADLVAGTTLPELTPVMGCSSCTRPDPVFGDCPELCALVIERNGSVFFSPALLREGAQQMAARGRPAADMPFLQTRVHYNTQGLLQRFAVRAAQTYADQVNDPYALRRRIFMRSEHDFCTFSVEAGDGTRIPVALIVCISSVWLASFVLMVVALALQRKRAYDVSNPLEWAFRTFVKDDAAVPSDPVIRMMKENESRPFYVTEAVP